MADKNLKNTDNVPGKYYVDNTCIDCDMCRVIAPDIFKRHDDHGYSYVARQPATQQEWKQAEEARDSCPTSTIGNDGE